MPSSRKHYSSGRLVSSWTLRNSSYLPSHMRPLHLPPLPPQPPLALSPLSIFSPLHSQSTASPPWLWPSSRRHRYPRKSPSTSHKNAFLLGSTILHLKTLFLDLLDLPSNTFKKQPSRIQGVEKYHRVTARCSFLMSTLIADPVLFLLVRLCQQGFREYQRCVVHS